LAIGSQIRPPAFKVGTVTCLLALAAIVSLRPLSAQEEPSSPVPDTLREAVAHAEASGDPGAFGHALLELGLALQDRGQPHEAVETLGTALPLLERSGRYDELARAQNAMGLIHWSHARYDLAIFHLDQARTLWTDLGDEAALGRVYNNLGATHYQWGNYAPALDAFLRARDLRRATGDLRGEALVLANIGRTYHDWELFDRARATLDEAISVAEASGDAFALAYALHNVGVLEASTGNFSEAREHFQASLRRYGSGAPGLTPGDAASGWALNTLGIASSWVSQGNPEPAIPILEEALASARAEGHTRRELRALVHLGKAHRARGDLEAATEALERALVLSREVEQRTLALEALEELATVHEARGAHTLALAHLRAYDALRDSIFSQSAAQRVAAMEAQAEADRRERENVRLREGQRVQEAVIARQRLVFVLGGGFLVVSLILVGVLVHFNRVGRDRERLLAETNAALEDSNRDLREALSEVQTLEGLIPICVHCKNVRDDQGFWEGVETYISSRSEALFSHSICAECGPRIYGEDWEPPQAPQDESAPSDERRKPSMAGPEGQ
jgi:tetratricopeptide (TPR) repeat protein